MRKKAIKTLYQYAFVVLLVALLAEFVIFGGAHPECAYNDSVGPCEFVPRVSEYLYITAFLLLPVFLIIFVVGYLTSRNEIKQKKK
jgi:hypothetical protein